MDEGFDAHEIIERVWLGSYSAATSPLSVLKKVGITHVLTIEETIDPPYPNDLEYYVIKESDLPLTNLIQYFEETHQFIEKAISSGGAVLVHCMAGISRSSTIVCSFLMKKFNYTPREAISTAKNIRRIIGPNKGFVQQLELFEKLKLKVPTLEEAETNLQHEPVLELCQFYHNIYIFDVIDAYRALIDGDDEEDRPKIRKTEFSSLIGSYNIDCRACGNQLCSSNNVFVHSIMPSGLHWWRLTPSRKGDGECDIYMIEPIDWVRNQLKLQASNGELKCPHCAAIVGSYNWAGSACGCDYYITPSFCLQKSACSHAVPHHFF